MCYSVVYIVPGTHAYTTLHVYVQHCFDRSNVHADGGLLEIILRPLIEQG